MIQCKSHCLVLLWGLLYREEISIAMADIIMRVFIPALNVNNSRLLLAGVTSNVALNIAVTVAL